MDTEVAEGTLLQASLAGAVRRMKSEYNYSHCRNDCRRLTALVDFAEEVGREAAASPLGARVAVEARLAAVRIRQGSLAEGERADMAPHKARLLETVLGELPARRPVIARR